MFFSVDFFFFGGGGGRRIFFLVGRGGGGGGENILTYLFKYCRGFTCLAASASGEPLLKLFLGGMSRNFSGMGDGRIYKHTFDYIWIRAGHLWPALGGTSAHLFFMFT